MSAETRAFPRKYFFTLLLASVSFLSSQISVAAQDGAWAQMEPGRTFKPSDYGWENDAYYAVKVDLFNQLVQADLDNEDLQTAVELLEDKVEIYDQIAQMRTEQLQLLNDGYDHYRQRYLDALEEQEVLEVQLYRERGRRYIFTVLAAAAGAFAAGMAID